MEFSVLFAQAEAAGRIATSASERLFEYGGLGVIVVILFAILIGGMYLGFRYMLPSLMAKWATDQKWFQEELARQDANHSAARREQAIAFIEALDRVAVRFSEDLRGLRSDFREELKAVVGVVAELKVEVNTKLDKIMSAVSVDQPPRRGSYRADSGGG